MNPALAGQIIVTIVLAAVVGVLLAAGLVAIYFQYQEMVARHERRMELRRRAVPEPHDVKPWIPADAETLDDDAHEDSEHMRVVREATP
ncbi:MAG: hypothetical protein ACSLFE_08245 [Gemmatimonadaceae bacterium]